MSLLDKVIEKRLGGYKQPLNCINTELPEFLMEDKKVAIIGAGLAGIGATSVLCERGFSVDLFERDSFIGGKVGSWQYGDKMVEHGFHAFFRQYYNLRQFMKKIGSFKHLKPISDYQIFLQNKHRYSFADVAKAPIENILSLRATGIYSIKEIMLKPKHMLLKDLLTYCPEETFKKYDHISFKHFARNATLNSNMQLMFNTFARAFFAEPEDISMAELIKGFHYYFLSNNLGLLYDVLDDDFEYTLLRYIRTFFSKHRVNLHLNTPITNIEKTEDGFIVNGKIYDYCVMATESNATKEILKQSNSISSAISPESYPSLEPSGHYAVLRLWMDKRIGDELPYFIFVDRLKILDSITFYHSMEKSSDNWSRETDGGVYELHAYIVPKKYNFTKEEVEKQLIEEFYHYFPSLKSAKILDSYYQYRSDFTSFHMGMYRDRPTVQSNTHGLYFAGDWVKLNHPSMLMEAAWTSGAQAANNILTEERLQEYPLYTVPKKGIFTP